MAALRLRALAERLGGREVEAEGDPELVAVASLDEAGPGALSFVRSARFQDALARTGAAAVVAPPGVDTGKLPTLRSPNPNLDFAHVNAIEKLEVDPERLGQFAVEGSLGGGQ